VAHGVVIVVRHCSSDTGSMPRPSQIRFSRSAYDTAQVGKHVAGSTEVRHTTRSGNFQPTMSRAFLLNDTFHYNNLWRWHIHWNPFNVFKWVDFSRIFKRRSHCSLKEHIVMFLNFKSVFNARLCISKR
jgi:hypothetical protein